MPDHWQETTLGEVCEVRMGQQLAPSRRTGDRPRRYLRAANVTLVGIGLEDVLEMDFSPEEEARLSLRENDLLLVEGGNEKSVGCPALVTRESVGLCIQNTLLRCRVNDSSVALPEFLYQSLMNAFLQREFARVAQGTTILHLGQRRAVSIPVVLPPLEEQRRIVDLVESIDTFIDSLETQIETTRTARIALTTALLDSLDGTQTKSLAEIEDEGLVELGRGKVISKKTMSSNPGDFPVYSSAAQNDGMIGSYNEYMFDEELITWSVDGGGHLFHRRRHKFSVTNIGGYLRILDPTKLRYGYLCAVLQGLHSRCHFDWQHKAHPSVIRYEYSKIPIPEMAQQQEIEQTIEAIDEQISSLESQVETVRTLRSGVLSELLSGERLLDESYDLAVGI